MSNLFLIFGIACLSVDAICLYTGTDADIGQATLPLLIISVCFTIRDEVSEIKEILNRIVK